MTKDLGPIPQWIQEVRPGIFDRRILEQDRWWVNEAGTVLAIAAADADATRKIKAVSTEHLHNIVDFLHYRAPELHLDAMLRALDDALSAEASHQLSVESLTGYLTGSSVATVTAQRWLEATTLMRAIRRELRHRAAVPF